MEATKVQEARCQVLAEREGYDVVAVHADDGISGFTGKTRPGWLNLIDGVQANRYDVVLAVAEDRFTRSTQEKIGFQAECAKHGVIWHALASGKVDPATAEGGLMSTITGAIAEFESHVKRERVKASVERRLALGKDLGGPRPFGFTEDRSVIVEAEAELVRTAYRMVLDGESLYSIAQVFAASGIPTSRGSQWRAANIGKMLRRGRYAGILEHNGTEVPGADLPAIVDRETWEAARAILDNPARTVARGPKPKLWTAVGLVECSVCGSKLASSPSSTTVKGKTYRYDKLRCPKHASARHDGITHPSIRTEKAERELAELVFMQLVALAHSPEQTESADLTPLRVRHAELARKRQVQQEIAEAPGADVPPALKRIAELGRELAETDSQITAAVVREARASLHALAR